MALKDIGVGFGVLSGNLDSWHCPECDKSAAVSDWATASKVVAQRSFDGRKCPSPNCEFNCATVGDSQRMVDAFIKYTTTQNAL